MYFNTLCLSGGGTAGILQLIILKKLINNKILNIKDINKFVGTSVGSIISTLLSINYTNNDIFNLVQKISINKIKSLKSLDYFYYNFGLDDGKNIINLINILFKKKNFKPNITFFELYKKTKKELIIIGFNLTKKKEICFSYKKTPKFKVIDAIRISISIPFYFTPFKYKNNLYVDGALCNNFPIKYCDINKTVGINIIFSYKNNKKDTDLIDYIFKILSVIYSKFVKKINHQNIININCLATNIGLQLNKNIFDSYHNNYNNIINKKLNNLHFFSIKITNRIIKRALKKLRK